MDEGGRGEKNLAELQRWMLGALYGGDGDRGPGDTRKLVLPSRTLSAEQRLDLYRRSYVTRLVDCLREIHPALRHLLGDEVFDAFALDYVAARPPRSYTLFDLGAAFSVHLVATRAEDDRAATEPWSDLVIDVVRLERAFLEVYDGPGVEGRSIPSALDVLATPAGARVRALSVPCARLFHSRYPVGDYVLAVRRGDHPDVPLPAPTWLALVRREYAVRLVRLGARSHAALAALFAGADSAEAAQTAGTAHGTIRQWMASWADQGLFARVSTVEALDHRTPRRKEIPCS
jgi:hypothetical protein